MYYKIENKESKVYKKLYKLRMHEKQINQENEKKLKEKIGNDFQEFLGYNGQLNMERVTQYTGFKFLEPKKIDPKVWVNDKTHPEIFVPNKKTKAGREMHQFLLSGLKGSSIFKVFEILSIEPNGKIKMPFIEVRSEIIILMIDDNYELTDPDFIEITKKEFDEIYKTHQS